MNKEQETLITNVKNYLLKLGYTQLQIQSDVKTAQGEFLDFVVYFNEKPWIAVEAKKNVNLYENDYNELRFNPHVRFLQLNAKDINSPYYLLTNGTYFLWFTTDSSGRPEVLDNPIFPPSKDEIISSKKDYIIKAFRHLKNILLYKKITVDSNLEAAILIFFRLLNRDRSILQKDIYQLEDMFNKNGLYETLNLSNDLIQRIDKYTIKESLELLYNLDLEEVSPLDILAAIDTVFLKAKKREFPVTRWLADFMVQLNRLNKNSIVYDLNSGMGEVLAAAILSNGNEGKPLQLFGICQTIENSIWAKIQQLILGQPIRNIFIGNFIDLGIENYHYQLKLPTNIIAAVPFGKTYDKEKYRSNFELSRIEDMYLEQAINLLQPHGRIVALVPESFLFTEGKRKQFRQYIFDTMKIKAIIGLPNGIFLPYSSIKASILVLDKTSPLKQENTFIAQMELKNIEDTFECREVAEINSILSNFKLFDDNQEISNESPYYWIIPRQSLSLNNLSAANYIPLQTHDRITMSYPMVSLIEISHIKRGKNIKLDEIGNVTVIGPAAIRPLDIDINNLKKTSEYKIEFNSSKVEVGDIVMNNIGNYLGASAIIDNDLDGNIVSQHVIVIKPNTSLVLPEYLALILNSDFVKSQILQRATGAIMPAVSITNLRNIKIPLPSLEVQTKISKKVKENTSEIKILREKLKQKEKELTNLMHRVFSEGGEE